MKQEALMHQIIKQLQCFAKFFYYDVVNLNMETINDR